MILFVIYFIVLFIGEYVAFSCGKVAGREEIDLEKAIEVVKYNGKEIVLISEDYFSMEQAEQIKNALDRDKPIIYKPSKK
jgi:hypothetical protein